MTKAKTFKFHRAVGAMLKESREAQGMSQQQVADKLKTTFQMVQNWERGTKRGESGKMIPTPMSIVRYVDFCNVLGMDAGQTLTEVINKVGGKA